jgi:hypothetical protein
MRDVTSAKIVDGYTVEVTFDDGETGLVDLAFLLNKGGVFEPLADPEYFRQVRVNPEIGTICWPNGADICPDVLYSLATGKSLPEWAEEDIPSILGIASHEVRQAGDRGDEKRPARRGAS